jgi:hypothetical protein
MALLGKAAVAMWWRIRPAMRAEFGDWHSHEHFPERMSIPGFRRGTRWTSSSDAEGFFVMYELEDYETLTSTGYLERLNAPTPWSTKMMPHHLNMMRSQCRIAVSFGGGVATSLSTIRFSPQDSHQANLKAALTETLREVPALPGLTGAHLLVTDTPGTETQTKEQRIRGGDAAADWIILLSGYDVDAVNDLAASRLSADALHSLGAKEASIAGSYKLAFAMTAGDVAVS